MKMLKNNPFVLLCFAFLAFATGCQKGVMTSSPNVASTGYATTYLNAITARFYSGGGVIDGATGAVSEAPWGQVNRLCQYHTSNYSYYMGTNTYNWSYSATQYDMLRYVKLMETQAAKQYTTTPNTNIYAGLGKFFRAYLFIWLAQRVGDIPMTQAGDASILTPTYNTQKAVYDSCLNLLDSANTIIGNIIKNNSNGSTVVDASGDIFGLTYLQWQKVVNTYKLRVLISLSKRADDNTDMNIKSQFAAIVNDTATYPIMSYNSDNMVYKFNSVNEYPMYNSPYNIYGNICKTYLNLTTKYADPRTFMIATPAPAMITAGKSVSDFSAYVGADPNLTQAQLSSNSGDGDYSFINYNRYFTSITGANCEPFILIGYPEMCFNIAEAINRGWVSGDASSWYMKGVNASLALYGLTTDGVSYSVGDKSGTVLGKVTIDLATFRNNIAYQGGTTGLQQILEQKYIAMFNNSGWEPYYNWRRTGVPSFAEGGSGIGTSNSEIPRRWMYPATEISENATNYQAAITSQFGGTDDMTQDTWLTK